MKSKEDWQRSIDQMKALQKKFEEDLEEVIYTIECYEVKIAQFGS